LENVTLSKHLPGIAEPPPQPLQESLSGVATRGGETRDSVLITEAAVGAPAGASTTPSALLAGTAFVTMASDDNAARIAVTLMQSLRDVGTAVPNLVVLLMRGGIGSADCKDAQWKKRNGRTGIRCGSLQTIEPEIVSEPFLASFARLGVRTQLVNPIPQTEWTKGIPGGAQMFWGEEGNGAVCAI